VYGRQIEYGIFACADFKVFYFLILNGFAGNKMADFYGSGDFFVGNFFCAAQPAIRNDKVRSTSCFFIILITPKNQHCPQKLPE
jgi:hypothetical protein